MQLVWHVGSFIEEELKERRWTSADLAKLMGGDPQVKELQVNLLIHCGGREDIAPLDLETATELGRAFGTSPQLWINIDKQYKARLR